MDEYKGSDADVVIPGSVTKIGEGAFEGCTSLASVSIPEGVTEIGEDAFSGCTSLTSVTIPEGVTKIGRDAFCGCSSLKEIRFAGTKEKWEAVKKGEDWNKDVPAKDVLCSREG